MGGWIAFGMAEFAPDRVDRVVIGGQHPYARDMEGFRQLARAGIEEGPNAFLSGFEQMAGTPPPGYRGRLLEADYRAFLAMAQDRPSIESVLPKIAMPCCVYVCEADSLYEETKRASGLIRTAEFFSLPGLSHLQGFVRSDLVLPRVRTFLV